MSSSPNSSTKSTNILTRSKPFRLLVEKAYAVCDSDQAGEISKTELYAGLLLVHLNLAKYAGPAACYPPSRAIVDQLFEAADANHSGTIDKREFVQIIKITCAQILTRMMVYYLILILLVPLLARHFVDYFDSYIQKETYQEQAAEQTIGLVLFFLVIPMVWNHIDQYSKGQLLKHHKEEEQQQQQQQGNETTTSSLQMMTSSTAATSSKEE